MKKCLIFFLVFCAFAKTSFANDEEKKASLVKDLSKITLESGGAFIKNDPKFVKSILQNQQKSAEKGLQNGCYPKSMVGIINESIEENQGGSKIIQAYSSKQTINAIEKRYSDKFSLSDLQVLDKYSVFPWDYEDQWKALITKAGGIHLDYVLREQLFDQTYNYENFAKIAKRKLSPSDYEKVMPFIKDFNTAGSPTYNCFIKSMDQIVEKKR